MYRVRDLSPLGDVTETGKYCLPHKPVPYRRVCMPTPAGWPDASSDNDKLMHSCVNMGQGPAGESW